MCGRYTIRASLSDLQQLLPGLNGSEALEARYFEIRAGLEAAPSIASKTEYVRRMGSLENDLNALGEAPSPQRTR